MAAADLLVALESLQLLAQAFTPKHLRKVEITIPLKAEQLRDVEPYLPIQFEKVNTELLQAPKENDFIFMPSHGTGISEIRVYRRPLIGYRVEAIISQFNSDAVMLIEPETATPEKVFAHTLQMLYFDPGAQRMLWKNLFQKNQKEDRAFGHFDSAFNLSI